MTRPRQTTPVLIAACFGTLLAAVLTGCSREQADYPAATPAETIDSAQAMIVNGDARRLTDLIHAENEHMRSLLNQFGELLGNLQTLGEAVEARFPEELGEFREQTRRAAEDGTTRPLFARLVAAGRSSQTNRTFGTSQIDREGLTIDTGSERPASRGPALFQGPRSESQRKIINDIIKQLLADPYGWLAEGRAKLDTVYIADDTVSLTWDGRPLLPPFGLIMVERDGVWRLVPPTSYPGVSRMMPRSDDEWFVWGSMVKTLARVVEDLEADVRNGKVRNLTDLADTAVEKAAIPLMLIVFAYSNLMDEREAEATRNQSAPEPESTEPAPAESSPASTDPPTDTDDGP